MFTSKPPNLKIFGCFRKSMIVDSIPIFDFPPSSIYFNFFPKSSLTSEEVTALTFEEIFALGAAIGNLILFNKFLATGCFGNLTARVLLLFVAIFEIFDFFLS